MRPGDLFELDHDSVNGMPWHDNDGITFLKRGDPILVVAVESCDKMVTLARGRLVSWTERPADDWLRLVGRADAC